jgi:uncharacterized coiled-coil DUF342 family protein
MPLNRALEQFLNEAISDDADRDALRRYFEKFPELQKRFEGYLRQEDYDRLMNQVKKEREREQQQIAEWQKTVQMWENWVRENVPKHQQLVEAYNQLLARNQELEAQLSGQSTAAGTTEQTVREAAETYSGYYGQDNVNPDELSRRVLDRINRIGYATKSEVARIAAEEARKMIQEAEQTFVKQTVPAMAEQILKAVELRDRHEKEFGKPLDWRALARFAVEKNIPDLDQAYEAFTAPARLEKEREKIREEVRREVLSSNIPGAAVPPSAPDLGPLQVRMSKVLPPEAEEAEVGQGVLASLAAAELRREGKA